MNGDALSRYRTTDIYLTREQRAGEGYERCPNAGWPNPENEPENQLESDSARLWRDAFVGERNRRFEMSIELERLYGEINQSQAKVSELAVKLNEAREAASPGPAPAGLDPLEWAVDTLWPSYRDDTLGKMEFAANNPTCQHVADAFAVYGAARARQAVAWTRGEIATALREAPSAAMLAALPSWAAVVPFDTWRTMAAVFADEIVAAIDRDAKEGIEK